MEQSPGHSTGAGGTTESMSPSRASTSPTGVALLASDTATVAFALAVGPATAVSSL